MPRTLEELLERAQHAPGDAATRNALAGGVRAELVKQLERLGARRADRDDIAQTKVLTVVAHLVESGVALGAARSYVAKAAKFAWVDHVRARGRAGGQPDPLPDGEGAERLPPSLVVLPTEPHADDPDADRVARMRELLAEDSDMPAAYRRVLRAVYGDPPVAIETLAEAELEANPLDKHGARRTWDQARNAVDASLTRARKWLQARMAADTASRGGRR